MINLSGNKTDIVLSISSERDFLANYVKFQNRINNNICILLRQVIDKKVVCSIEQSEALYDNLSTIMDCLNKSNQCIRAVRRHAKVIGLD